eukprot:1147631-Pelagomonas_calceolata.AAC.2
MTRWAMKTLPKSIKERGYQGQRHCATPPPRLNYKSTLGNSQRALRENPTVSTDTDSESHQL